MRSPRGWRWLVSLVMAVGEGGEGGLFFGLTFSSQTRM